MRLLILLEVGSLSVCWPAAAYALAIMMAHNSSSSGNSCIVSMK